MSVIEGGVVIGKTPECDKYSVRRDAKRRRKSTVRRLRGKVDSLECGEDAEFFRKIWQAARVLRRIAETPG